MPESLAPIAAVRRNQPRAVARMVVARIVVARIVKLC
jgi:hypothetical protein